MKITSLPIVFIAVALSCIFNVENHIDVSGTNIVVGRTTSQAQYTIYENKVANFTRDLSVAMILPVRGKFEGWINLETNSKFFYDLEKELQIFMHDKIEPPARGCGPDFEPHVIQVGSYKCYYASNLDILSKAVIHPDLENFKLAPNVASLLEKHYGEGFGFAVFQLQAEGAQHPIGILSRDFRSELFIPTMHAHGESVSNKLEKWDHQIYLVNHFPTEREMSEDWSGVLCDSDSVKALRGAEIMDGHLVNEFVPENPEIIMKLTIQGERQNVDLQAMSPLGKNLHDFMREFDSTTDGFVRPEGIHMVASAIESAAKLRSSIIDFETMD